MNLMKSILWLNIIIVFLFCGYSAFGQDDTVKWNKIKFDWELGPPGAGVNFSIRQNAANSFGIGLNSLYFNLVITPSYFYDESEAFSWDYINCRIFYRNVIGKRIIFEYALKYSYSYFGCFYCDPNNVQLYGLQFAPIIGMGKAKYKPTIAVTRSIENPTIFIYIVPLVFNFKL
jgi:hypothetical protein